MSGRAQMTGLRLAAVLLLPLLLLGCPRRQQAPPAVDSGPRLVTVSISSGPSGAALLEQHKRLGKTPLTLRRPVGSLIHLRVVKDGYRHDHRNVLVEDLKRQRVHVRLQRPRATLVVKAGVLRGARIVIDGVDRGRTPDRVVVLAGRRRVRLLRQGYLPREAWVEVKGSQTLTVDLRMVPIRHSRREGGLLSVRSDIPALVSLGKDKIGLTPLDRIPLPAKRYRLTVRSERPPRSKRVDVRIVAGKHAVVEVELLDQARRSAKPR